ncbi:MAG TPA: S8 family peptidase, partial [Bryobacteraceae bacterium]|nr:S8 family peptidase [Bryobacteraceae bacterium]
MKKLSLSVVLWGGLLAAVLFAKHQKVSPDLNDQLNLSNGSVEVIVQFHNDPSDAEIAAVTSNGAKLKEHFKRFHSASFTVPVSAIDAVAGDPNVTYISPDRTVAAQFDYAEQTINAPFAWQLGLDGTGVGIALVDSGVAKVDDLEQANSHQSRVVYREILNASKGDEYGHGTHVAGILAGNGKDSTGREFTTTFRGVAPNANIIDLEVLDQNGMTTDSLVLKAISRAIDLKGQYNIRILNLSLGRPVFESSQIDPLCQAVQAAWQAGIVVVASAGNLGRSSYASILSPGNSPYAITVGAMKTMGTPARGDDLIASYSSKGPTWLDQTVKPDLVAPGNLMVSLLAPGSTLARTYPQNIVPVSSYSTRKNGRQDYFTLSGTSMATPVVSGAAALLIQNDPSLTPDTVKLRLMESATKNFPASSVAVDPLTGIAYTSQYDVFTIGAGYLDIMGALASSDVATAGTQSPAVFYDSASGNAFIVEDPTSLLAT